MTFFYNTILCLLALIAIPKAIYQRIRYGKYKDFFSKKFGLQFPQIAKRDRKLIWMHACSMGETKALITLAKLIKAEIDPIILITSTTETGHAEAKKSLPFADYHLYLPFDLSFVINPIVKQVSPDYLILSESEFWFNLMRQAKKVGAKIALVNGKISMRSLKRLQWLPSFSQRLFGFIDLCCVQNPLYADRFGTLGVPAEKVLVTGNLKFDENDEQLTVPEIQKWKQELGIASTDRVLVMGSTHDPEEALLLNILKQQLPIFPDLKTLIVPRHPERFSDVAKMIEKMRIPYIRLSEIDHRKGDEKVILVDKMGVLRKVYQLADVALVGGSFTDKVGGHNIIEPSGYGVPVVFGPHMHTQAELVALVKEYGAGEQVEEQKLADLLREWLGDAEKRRFFGENGVRLVEAMKGATTRTWKAIQQI